MKNTRNINKLLFTFTLMLLLLCQWSCRSTREYLQKSPAAKPAPPSRLVFEREIDIPTGQNPWGMAVDPVGARVFVVSTMDNTLDVIDLIKKEKTLSIDTGMNPWHCVYDERRNRLYVTNGDDESISIIDLDHQKEVMKVVTGKTPFGINYSSNMDEIYVANYVFFHA